MSKNIKFIVYGQSDSGKTTFVESLKDKYLVNGTSFKEKKQNSYGKVIYIDYGDIYVDKNGVIRLYSQPVDALDLEALIASSASILLLNPTKRDNHANHFASTKTILDKLKKAIKPFIIAASRHNDADSYSIAELRELLELPETVPLLECDPVTDPASAKRVLVELFKLMPQDDLVLAAIEKLS